MAIRTDAIEFDTRRTVNEIANILRSYRGNIERVDDDPFDGLGGPSPAIAVTIWDRVGFSLRHAGSKNADWAVQVFVTDQGESRHVELVAIGDTVGASILISYAGNRHYNLAFSRDHRNEIASLIS